MRSSFSTLGYLAKIGLSWGSSRSEEHTSELQSRPHLVCRLLLEKKNTPRSLTSLMASLTIPTPLTPAVIDITLEQTITLLSPTIGDTAMSADCAPLVVARSAWLT